MPSKRKNKTIPLQHPSTIDKEVEEKPLVELSEEEQWRLVRESGVLKKLSADAAEREANLETSLSLGDEIFNAALLIIPFSSLLLLMEILIRQQYSKKASLDDILDRMVPGVPILSLFIFYTHRHKRDRRMQLLLFALGTLLGSRLIYSMNNLDWLTNMQQAPPLATIWIYTIIQMDLGPAVLSLLAVWSFVWYKDLKVFK